MRPQMQFSAEGASGGGCPVWVEKKGKTLKPHFRCQSVGTVDFSMGSAAKSTSAKPSTNTPIQCPECGTKPMAQFFWKYKGMMAHWQRAHSTKTMPVELSEQLKISEKEKGGLVKFAKSSGAGAAKRKRASDAAAAPAATAAAARRLSAACEPKETAVAAAESAPKEAAEEAAPAAAMVETEETWAFDSINFTH